MKYKLLKTELIYVSELINLSFEKSKNIRYSSEKKNKGILRIPSLLNKFHNITSISIKHITNIQNVYLAMNSP